jgi:ERO1-like protein alpha
MDENEDYSAVGIYVNLLQNPERYTGYSGPNARRVWLSIMEENCFGGLDDSCLEKRVFYRLMSGLRASISTHIAREYHFASTGEWGMNIPLFIQAVGLHRDRMDNLYFSFLFLLRAVTKARDALLSFPFHTGNSSEDTITIAAIKDFLEPSQRSEYRFPSLDSRRLNMSSEKLEADMTAIESSDIDIMVEECRNGFDESTLFQVSIPVGYGNDALMEKAQLLEDFRGKFRNITRIMDCVSCEKCRLWGKLQILGIGTSIKILLSPREEINRPDFLTRQEVVALMNVLHQVARSVQFASRSLDYEFHQKLYYASQTAGIFCALAAFFSMAFYYCWRRRQLSRR